MTSQPHPKRPTQRILFAGGLIVAVSLVFGAGLQSRYVKGEPAKVALTYKNEVSISVKDGYREIVSNGIPDHLVGKFPGRGNPNTIAPVAHRYRVPVQPKDAGQSQPTKIFGVALNGVPFDPGTAELWNGDFRWHYEALSGALGVGNSLGVDENLAHVQPDGSYHYHGIPRGLLKKLGGDTKVTQVGWAADGYPVYGPLGYSVAEDQESELKELKSSYRLKEGNRPGNDGPSGAYDGSFSSDYEFKKGAGDLDANNGRFGVTPEYPNGTYYYVLTNDWPYIPRQLKGVPDSSFRVGPVGPVGPGGPGGQGGPGGFGGPGGPPQMGGGMPGGPNGRGRMGPPRNMLPGDSLAEYLGLTPAQKKKFEEFKKAVAALNESNFAMGEFPRLKLTSAQIHRLALGEKVDKVLTSAQREILQDNQRPGGGPEGGPMGGPPPNFPG